MDAIRHYKGPAMVIAGPGSGKTFVIVERLRYLIEEKKEDPSKILVITFTKAAAIEMQQRFYKLTDSSYPEVNFGTFHSVFYQIIRQSKSNKEKNISIADEGFKYKLLQDILADTHVRDLIKGQNQDPDEITDADIRDILTDISKVKNTGKDIALFKTVSVCKGAFKTVFELYNQRLYEFGKIDFDDMILKCLELLKEYPDTLEYWQGRFKFFLVDEYQDINAMQFKILKLLSLESPNVFVVGDDDQSIYGFRGSDPGIMLNFAESFKEHDPKRIVLDINYRCKERIIEGAKSVIALNSRRYAKNIKAAASDNKGYLIARRYKTKENQNNAIITYLRSGNVDINNVALIYRTNQEAMNMAGVLKEAGISTNLDKISKSFVEDEAVDICMAYLSFACMGRKRSDFLKLMNRPMRYITRNALTSDIISDRLLLDFYEGNRQKRACVTKLFSQLNMIAHLRPYLAVRFLRKDVGIDECFRGHQDALDRFMEEARNYPDNRLFMEAMLQKKEVIMGVVENRKNLNRGNCVKLLTMHGSKGLEYEVVWLPDLNEGIIPSRSAETGLEIEEERRMLYVGMTRAKQALIMSYVAGTNENPMLPSRFLRPIKDLWEKNKDQSRPSSGSSTISSYSPSSRY